MFWSIPCMHDDVLRSWRASFYPRCYGDKRARSSTWRHRRLSSRRLYSRSIQQPRHTLTCSPGHCRTRSRAPVWSFRYKPSRLQQKIWLSVCALALFPFPCNLLIIRCAEYACCLGRYVVILLNRYLKCQVLNYVWPQKTLSLCCCWCSACFRSLWRRTWVKFVRQASWCRVRASTLARRWPLLDWRVAPSAVCRTPFRFAACVDCLRRNRHSCRIFVHFERCRI